MSTHGRELIGRSDRLIHGQGLHGLMVLLGVVVLLFIYSCNEGSNGPLRVSEQNPRYFTDDSGEAILMTGSHTWNNLVDMGPTDPPALFDFESYLEWMQGYGHNFIRLWAWETVDWTTATANPAWGVKSDPHTMTPHPWLRTGPDTALDGKPKFDLKTFNEDYFDRLRSRLEAAQHRGIYVSIMLFEGWCLQFGPNAYESHPFHPQNNIQGLQGSLSGDSLGVSIHEIGNDPVRSIQEAYVMHVIDVVNDLDNVLYEISNENHALSTSWQYEMIEFIHDYEQSKQKQHPVGMTFQHKGGSNENLFKSPAEWISPNKEGGYKEDPPASDGSKVIINDTDHLWGIGGNSTWAWKSFCRGLNPIFMDTYDGQVLGLPFDEEYEPLRVTLGQIQLFSQKVDLIEMVPMDSLASTGYCLANEGNEYLVFLPDTRRVTVNLSAIRGSAGTEWFNPVTAETIQTTEFEGGGMRDFQSPFEDKGAILLIQSRSIK